MDLISFITEGEKLIRGLQEREWQCFRAPLQSQSFFLPPSEAFFTMLRRYIQPNILKVADSLISDFQPKTLGD